MTRLVPSALALVLLAGCASWQPPRPPSEQTYCRADSAVRYRGYVDPRNSVVRVAPPHGSCRHQ